MITVYKYSYGWREQKTKHNDDYVLGSKTKKLLDNKEQVIELLNLLQEQVDETQAESMDLYFDESNKSIFLTVKLFDEDDDLIKIFNVEHSIQRQEFILLLEFLEFGFEHDVNIYYFKGTIADRMNEYVDECHEIGQGKIYGKLKRR
mgnify:FL=1